MDELLRALLSEGFTADHLAEFAFTEAGARHAAADTGRLDEIIRLLVMVRDGDPAQQAAAKARLAAKAQGTDTPEEDAADAAADPEVDPTDPKAVAAAKAKKAKPGAVVEAETPFEFTGTVLEFDADTVTFAIEADDPFDATFDHGDILSWSPISEANPQGNNQYSKGSRGKGSARRAPQIPKGGSAFTRGFGSKTKGGYNKSGTSRVKGLGNATLKHAADPTTPTLIEAIEADGSVVDVLLIQPGMSKNRRNYPADVLREATPLFDGARAYASEGADHNPAHRGVKSLVGWYSNPRYLTGIPGPRGKVLEGVAAHLNVSANAAWLRSMLADSLTRGKPDLVGFSIVGDGEVKVLRESGSAGRPYQHVSRITAIESVDPVINPAAGGIALRLVASTEGSSMDWTKLTLAEAIRALATGTILPDELKENRADLAGVLAEGQVVAPVAAAPATDVAALIEAQLAPMRTATLVAEKLAERKLPEYAAARIREATSGKAFTAEQIDGLIKAEVDYLAKVNPAAVRESGAVVSGMVAEIDKIKEAAYEMLAGTSSDSIKAFYVDLTGDRSFNGKLGEGRLTESIVSSTFDQIMADSITRRMLDVYNQPGLDSWKAIAETVPVRDFRTQRRIRMGGYGNLPAVNQSAAYTALSTPADEEATYAPTKRGGTEDLTLEAIANDDLSALRQIPTRLGRAAAQTLHEFAWDFIATNPTIYDGAALFVAGKSNIGSAALDATALAAARLRMLKQAEPGSAKRLGISPKHLIVPLDLEQKAYEITATDREVGNAYNTLNFARTFGLNIITVPYWTDITNWYLAADKAQVPMLEIGFFNGQEAPELFLQDSPTTGNVFSNDKLTYKIRHIYGGAILDYRGFDGSIVAG